MGPHKELAEFLGQLHGLTQEHWHHFFGSFMGPHKSTGNISWPVARAHTVMDCPTGWSRGRYGPDSPVCLYVVLPLEVNAPVMWCGLGHEHYNTITNY